MKAIRCYLLRNGVIRAVEVLRCSSDEDAIEQGLRQLEKRKDEFSGIELWDGPRRVYHHSANVSESA
jgi:hypothetical protein